MLTLRPVRLNFSSSVCGTWTERIGGRYPYLDGEVDDIKFGAWARCCSPGDGSEFAWANKEAEEDYDSGTASPPLWKSTGSTVSPHELTRAIAQYQQEMLDMVREVPEGDYELSMKDLVELSLETEGLLLKENELPNSRFGREREQDRSRRRARKVSRTESMNHKAVLLKMPLPFPGGWRRSSDARRASAKVLPKPESTCRIEIEVEKSSESEFLSKETSNKRRRLSRFLSFFFGKSYFSSYKRRK